MKSFMRNPTQFGHESIEIKVKYNDVMENNHHLKNRTLYEIIQNHLDWLQHTDGV